MQLKTIKSWLLLDYVLWQKIYTFYCKILCFSHSDVSKWQISILLKKKLILLSFYPIYKNSLEKMRQDYILTKKEKISLSMPCPLLNPKSCSTWLFSQTCSKASDYPHIITIALFGLILFLLVTNRFLTSLLVTKLMKLLENS